MKSPIQTVSVWPSEANTLVIRPISFGPPVGYYFELLNVTVTPAVPAVGTEGEEGYVPAVPESTTSQMLKNGNVSMTLEQWEAWPAGPASDDDEYQLDCIAGNLGLTRA